MDAGDYETNTLLVNNLSSIAFKIYEPVVSQKSVYTFNASDVEFALRNDGHLVYMDVVRRGVWCFHLVKKDANDTSAAPEQSRLGENLEVCGYRLGLVGEGAFEPVSLQKSRAPGPNSINTPSSSSSNNSTLDLSARTGGAGASFSVPSAGPTAPVAMDLDSKVVHPVAGHDPKGYRSVPVKEMHEFFITAVLSSLSTAFCRCSGAIPLTPRTLLLPPNTLQASDSEPVRFPPLSALATFRVYLTTTGSLVISLSVSAMEGLIAASDSLRSEWYSAGTPVLAAPLGAFASLQSILDKDHILHDAASGQSPETQVSRFRPEVADKLSQWRSHISKLLQLRGMAPSILEGCSWINIQFLKKKPYEYKADGKRTPMTSPAPVVSWPSVLCFRKPTGSLLHDLRLGQSVPGDAGDFDPLDNAKSWFEGNPEREEQFTKRRRKEHQNTSRREAAAVDGRKQPQTDPAPVTLRRISNAGAAAAATAGTMYPTPPDGVQQPPGVTPSFDVVMSSPPNQSANVAPAGSDPVSIPEGRQTRSSSGGWDTDAKREQSVTAYPEGDNLFGDIGEDLFENNELTDADFNFFDQDTGDSGLDLSSLSNMPDAMDLSDSLKEPGAGLAPSAVAATEAGPEEPVSPVFTKPELKHARSTLGEEPRPPGSASNSQASVAAGIKRHPSPFDPDTVYKRVRASFSGPPATKRSLGNKSASRRDSVFERVDFDPSLSLTSKKYGASGQFRYKLPSHDDSEERLEAAVGAVPSLQMHRRRDPKELPGKMKFGDLMAKITAGLENNSLNNSPTKFGGTFSDGDDFSLVSDQDDSSVTSDEPSSPAKFSVSRRPVDDDNMSLAASFRDLDQHTTSDSPAYAMADLSRLSQPGTPELPVTKYFADPEPWPLQLSCRDDDFITIAQILTEQAVSGSLMLGPRSNSDLELQETRRSVVNATRHAMQCLRSILPGSLTTATECQLRPFIEVQDVPLLGQPTRMQPRPLGIELTRHNLFQIPAPHVELRRYDSKLSVLPSAVSFWESLGLSPSQGPKDINAICVFPDWKGMQDNAVCFLDRIRSIYESLKMGTFDRLLYGAEIPSGLFPYSVDKMAASPLSATSPQRNSALSTAMSKLANNLARFIVTEKNHVVYFVYTPDSPGSIVEACFAFQDLFEKYKKAVSDRKKSVANELVLQLIPLDFLASQTSIAILPPSEYVKLCIETYDRCIVFGGPMPAPAIVLEPALPRIIEFKPTPSPSANVMHENSCIHIAYARSVDERWITAAWTDNRGIKQMTASYCLGRRGRPLSNPLEEITREIWDTTHDLISMWKVHWRVIITKCGPMEQNEIDGWLALSAGETKASISLTLMTVDTNPSLQLIPPPAKIPVTMSSAFYTTPVSTPQPMSTVSPEQSGNPTTPMAAGGNPMTTATTPGGGNSIGSGGGGGGGGGGGATTEPPNNATELEPDAVLVDVTDTTWGAMASHRLNNSSSLTELNPALQSGYLVKRSGPRPEDPPVAMEVNVVYVDAAGVGGPTAATNPRAYEAVLREMLVYFRGLGTLARLRGVVDRETDVRPWHVAAAEKGVRALYQLL